VTRTAAGSTSTASAPPRVGPTRWGWTASLAAAGAGVLHVAAAAGHLAAGDLVVGFFLLTALAQLGLGAWLVRSSWPGGRPGAWPLVAALAGTVLLVGLYLVAHTTDLLAGLTAHGAGHGHDPAAGHAAGASIAIGGPVALGEQPSAGGEPPGLLGTTTVALELLAVLGLAALLPPAWRTRALDALLALGALAWVLWLTGVLG
jgi:hypothetical protein